MVSPYFKILVTIIVLWTLRFSVVQAQTVLTVEEAINTALKNSYDLKIARNNTEIAEINNSYGVAGGLPTILGTAGASESSTSLDQLLFNGTETKRDGVRNSNQNAGINANWTIFNGFYVVSTKLRLAEIEKQSWAQLSGQILTTTSFVMTKYYDLVRLQNYVKTFEKSIAVSQKKLEIIELRKNSGLANDADYFQAQLDYNMAMQDLRSQKLLLKQGKIDLMQLLAKPADTAYSVSDSISFSKSVRLDSVIQFISTHPQVASIENIIRINELTEKQILSQRMPSLRMNMGFNYARSQNSAGISLLNQTYGPTVGLNLSVPIYNGGIYSKQQQVQKVNTLTSRLQRESLLLSMNNSASKAFETYQT
ncbi:MAG: TolC family protein, partial [Cytophagales bacterium]|nr:TolC family protein [Cytophagales bacterium]